MAKEGHVVWLVVLASLICAVPVWRTMTKTYVAPLPYERVYKWHEQSLNESHWDCRLNVRVLIATDPSREGNAHAALARLDIPTAFNTTGQPFCTANVISRVEIFSEHKWQTLTESQTLEAMDSFLSEQILMDGDYTVFILPELAGFQRAAYLGKGKTAWLTLLNEERHNNTQEILSALAGVVRCHFLGDEGCSTESSTAEAGNRTVAAPISGNYRVSFTLLNGHPNEGFYNWSFIEEIMPYLSAFMVGFRHFGNITFDSQIVGGIGSNITPSKLENATTYVVDAFQVSRMINPDELIPDPTVTAEIGLSMILYIPPTSFTPLSVQSETGLVDNFVIPGQGGVLIHNSDSSECVVEEHRTKCKLSPLKLQYVASVFASQLRVLFGLDLRSPPYRGSEVVSPTGLLVWELEALLLQRTWKSMTRAAETLTTICELARRQGHLALPDRVSLTMKNALCLLDEARNLASLRDFRGAHRAAIEAAAQATSAAQDPDSVSMLHYPDEHEIAIYVPHFLPVFWPIVTGLLAIFLGLVYSACRQIIYSKK